MIQIIGIGIFVAFLLWLQLKIYKKLWKKDLKVSVQFDCKELFEGERGLLLEVIENAKWLPIIMLNVKFQTDKELHFDDEKGARTTDRFYRNDIFQINGNEKITRGLPFIAGKRGYYQINHVDLVGTDLLMSNYLYGELKIQTTLYVFPQPFSKEELLLSLNQINGEILSKRYLLEDPFEYRGIREYQPYDDIRTINWKATAKTGQLKVNQKSETCLKEVRVFINIDDRNILKKTECMEASFRIAVGVVQYFMKNGMHVSCFCNGLDCLTDLPMIVESSFGDAQLQRIYRNLSRIDLNKQAIGFTDLFGERIMEKNKDILTVFISPNQYLDFVNLLEKYQMDGKNYVWYYPLWDRKEPKLPETLHKNMHIIHIR